MVNKERMELWIQALEQDRFKQCFGILRKEVRDGGDGEVIARLHCALGVGIEVALENGLFSEHPKAFNPIFNEIVFTSSGGLLPTAVAYWYGIDENPSIQTEEGTQLIVSENDGAVRDPRTFWEIAQDMR